MAKGTLHMELSEVEKLMSLKGWSYAELAGHLHLSEAAIIKWFQRGQAPDGPAVVLMRGWLDGARPVLMESRDLKVSEIEELLELRTWNNAILAGHLHLTESAVDKWFQGGVLRDSPAAVLIRLWLSKYKARGKVLAKR